MYLSGRGGQFVHAADVSNIDIEERSKKVAVYELKVERIRRVAHVLKQQ